MTSEPGDSSVTAAMAQKWGAGVVEASGFTQVPNYLIAANQFLVKEARLSPTEFLVLMQLLQSWWRADQFPFPSKATLATRTGLSERQVQRALSGLENKAFLKRVDRLLERGGRSSNLYDLSGVVQFVQDAVQAFPGAFKRKVTQKRKEPRPSLAKALPSSAE